MSAWWREEEGQALVETALLLGLVALVALVAVGTLGQHLPDAFQRIGEALFGG
ncbi:Flp family type IVb pilin [Desulfothermobacter acidiphilus]|uniref:Flp family type IVb pilin n=1 Tax=Desulfothermobacter acidiphilus TaxID=1938353 RepID=UPI003F8B0F1C